MKTSEDNAARPSVAGQTPPVTGCAPCAARSFTEWNIETRQTSELTFNIHETTALCRFCRRTENFTSREPTTVGRLLAVITKMLPAPTPEAAVPEARPVAAAAD